MKLTSVKELEQSIQDLSKIDSWDERIKELKEIKILVNKNIEKLDKLKEKVAQPKEKKVKNYKEKTLDELLELFNSVELNKKVSVFQQINFLLKQLENEIINEPDTDSESI
jgi:hypothetical protein